MPEGRWQDCPLESLAPPEDEEPDPQAASVNTPLSRIAAAATARWVVEVMGLLLRSA
jgi:hypothetical protein